MFLKTLPNTFVVIDVTIAKQLPNAICCHPCNHHQVSNQRAKPTRFTLLAPFGQALPVFIFITCMWWIITFLVNRIAIPLKKGDHSYSNNHDQLEWAVYLPNLSPMKTFSNFRNKWFTSGWWTTWASACKMGKNLIEHFESYLARWWSEEVVKVNNPFFCSSVPFTVSFFHSVHNCWERVRWAGECTMTLGNWQFVGCPLLNSFVSFCLTQRHEVLPVRTACNSLSVSVWRALVWYFLGASCM